MKRVLALVPLFFLPLGGLSVDLTEPHRPSEGDYVISAPEAFFEFDALRPLISAATVQVSSSEQVERISWPLDKVSLQVLLGKLQQLEATEHPYDAVFAEAPEMDPAYDGIKITFTMLPEAEQSVPNLWFHKGAIKTPDGLELYHDPGRVLEYWIFGSSDNRAAMLVSLKSLPVFTFEQCLALGHSIVETDPRQCVMPNEIVMLDLGLAPTVDPLTVNSFDDCLDTGLAIMNTFPRRCLTKGGKLVAEPPRRPDGSIILPGDNE
jgi:hypothetical protein